MKVLFITFIRPSSKFGGGISTLQSLKALSESSELDYMGIDYDETEFESYNIKIKNCYIVEPTKSKIKLILQLIISGNSSSYYRNWVDKINKYIDISNYDCVFLDYTRHGFVADWVKLNKTTLIVRSHNIEADYFTSLFKKKKSIENFLHILTGKKNEKKCLELADKILVLTRNEENRYVDMYGIDKKKFSIYPQCVKNFDYEESYSTDKPYILITGTLWFGPNADGTEWFLDNVWSQVTAKLNKRYKLVIAGAKPNEGLKLKSKELEDVELIANPKEIGPFYKGASLYVVPIFYGAGMKVKVAEALACGLKVIATTHSLAGYDLAYDYMIKANTKEEFIELICNEIHAGIGRDKEKILDIYRNHYSLEASTQIIANELREVEGGN